MAQIKRCASGLFKHRMYLPSDLPTQLGISRAAKYCRLVRCSFGGMGTQQVDPANLLETAGSVALYTGSIARFSYDCGILWMSVE